MICNAILCSVAVWNLSLAQSVGQNCRSTVYADGHGLAEYISSASRCVFNIFGCFLYLVSFHNVRYSILVPDFMH